VRGHPSSRGALWRESKLKQHASGVWVASGRESMREYQLRITKFTSAAPSWSVPTPPPRRISTPRLLPDPFACLATSCSSLACGEGVGVRRRLRAPEPEWRRNSRSVQGRTHRALSARWWAWREPDASRRRVRDSRWKSGGGVTALVSSFWLVRVFSVARWRCSSCVFWALFS